MGAAGDSKARIPGGVRWAPSAKVSKSFRAFNTAASVLKLRRMVSSRRQGTSKAQGAQRPSGASQVRGRWSEPFVPNLAAARSHHIPKQKSLCRKPALATPSVQPVVVRRPGRVPVGHSARPLRPTREAP